MTFENSRKMVKLYVRRALFCVVLSVIAALSLSVPIWAQQERSRDKDLTGERPDKRVQIQAPASLLPQEAACDGNNFDTNNFNNNVFMGGPIVAIAWTPVATETITRIEVFTGETAGPNALAIWSDDGGSPSRPLANLSNTNSFSLSLANSWQGADLLTPVTVTAGGKYWIVYDPAGGEQCPCQNGTGQQYWGGSGGTITGTPAPSWFGPFSFPDRAWKFRVFCVPPAKDVYAVKFLCGNLKAFGDERVEAPVQPGNYLTAINVHNPNPGSISFKKKAVLLFNAEKPGEPEQPMSPGRLFEVSLKDDWGMEIDCSDIRNRLLKGIVPAAPVFIKGFVVIEVSGAGPRLEPRPLDVTAVYTSHGWNLSGAYEGFAQDIDRILPKRIRP
jgi:hypothetical protein